MATNLGKLRKNYNREFEFTYAEWFRGKGQYFGRVIVSVIVRKKLIWTCVQFWIVTKKELFESANTEALLMVIKKDKLLVNFIFMFKNDKFVSQKWHISYNHRHNLVGQGGRGQHSLQIFLRVVFWLLNWRGAKKIGLVGESGVCILRTSSNSLCICNLNAS